MSLDIDHVTDETTLIPLHSTTWELDKSEGAYVNHLKETHTEALSEPILEVPDDLDRNIAVTSVDALVNWGRKSAVWPLSFGLACCAFEMMASAMSRLCRSMRIMLLHGKTSVVQLKVGFNVALAGGYFPRKSAL